MTWIEEYAAKRCAESKEFAEAYVLESAKLDIAVALTQMRDELGLSQQQLADLSGKPQSTIARIERASMNPSIGLLAEIAASVGKGLEVRFVDDGAGEQKARTEQRTVALGSLDGLLGSPVPQAA